MTGPAPEVLLRNVREDDLPIFFDHQRDPVANEMAAFDARDTDAFMAHWTKILGDESVVIKAIVMNGEVAGNIVSWGPLGERLVGYWIGREFWGNGIATKALAAFLGHEKTRPLHAHVAKHNVGSIRVLEKCGFTISAEERVSTADGTDVEEFLMSLEA